MGISNIFNSLCFSVVVLVLFILFLTNFSFLLPVSSSSSFSDDDDDNNNSYGKLESEAPPPQQMLFKSKNSSFKPSVAVIVGVLTTIFSVTFLLLLYAKHCRRDDRNNAFFFSNPIGYPSGGTTTTGTASGSSGRRNSGIDRAVIESLPIFRFGSLRGQKDGLECAVCLNRFESNEVLRLLPKCKHAFHVECVDTWLDAHSTCPLCRYRVDPEDILLVEDNRIMYSGAHQSQRELGSGTGAAARVSGRHSFAGSSLEVISEKGKSDSTTTTSSSASFVPRRSLDSWSFKKKRNSEIVTVGCFDRHRKDGLLLSDKTTNSTTTTTTTTTAVVVEQRRLEHRIIVSGAAEQHGGGKGISDGPNRRWSDVQASDLLFLGSSEMMIPNDSRRFTAGSYRGLPLPLSPSSSSSRPSVTGSGGGVGGINERNGNRNQNQSESEIGGAGAGGRRNEINGRSVSEITGMSRFRSNEQHYEYQQRQQRQAEQRQRQAGAISRWLAWISQPQTQNHHHHHHRQQQNNLIPPYPPPISSSLDTSSSTN